LKGSIPQFFNLILQVQVIYRHRVLTASNICFDYTRDEENRQIKNIEGVEKEVIN
jgi:hypothetical protein